MRTGSMLALMTAALSGLLVSTAAAEQFAHGEAAIEQLGSQIDEVAAEYGATAAQLVEKLREDPSLHVTEHNVLVFLDEGSPAAEPGLAAEAAPSADAHPGTLHSRPGADRILYLDFDGGTYAGGSNTILRGRQVTIPAYTGSAESVHRIWARVSEDFAPFGIDVTTEEPPPADLQDCSDRCGGRVSIGGSSRSAGFGGVRGVAAGGVLPGEHVAFGVDPTPAFVFPVTIGDNEEDIAVSISHEAGHLLGLVHHGDKSGHWGGYYGGHGSGATSWCPIMGSCRGLTQWSRGEYPAANNTEQDDIAIIAAKAPVRADDVPATSPLGGSPLAVDQRGTIGIRDDTDSFTFASGAGPATFAVSGAHGSNLDAQLTLLDEGGAVVAQANDPEGLEGMITVDLPAGDYVLQVDGVGDVDPAPGYTDYGSLGGYHISGSYPRPPTALAADPALVSVRPLSLPLFRLSATLLKAGAPAAGRKVSFSVGNTAICSGVTNAEGVASCSGVARLLDIMVNGDYDARFAGDAHGLPSAAKGALVR